MGKAFDKLTSARAAVFLMAALVLLVLVSAIVPQKGFETGRLKGTGIFSGSFEPAVRALKLDQIYDSPFFLALLALLALGLIVGSLRRLAQIRRMRSASVRVQHLSSVVFHIALVVILAGVMLNRSFKFEGAFGLTEGQQVADEPDRYVKSATGSLRGDRFGRFRLTLDSIDLDHPVGDATTPAAHISVTRGSGTVVAEGPAAINAPLRWDDLEFHLGSLVGYSPEIIVLDRNNEVLQRHFVRVGGRLAEPGKIVHEDYIDGPASGQKLGIRVADAAEGGEPRVSLTVLEGETVILSGTVAVGDTLRLGEARVAVPRMRRWCYIHVVENPWVWLIFSGFWIGLAGLSLSAIARLLPNRKSHEEPIT